MFEEIKERFYKSLAESIKDRKKTLHVARDKILPDPNRVTDILKPRRDEHHPYLIGRDEYPRLIFLFQLKEEDFIKKNVAGNDVEILREECGNNYDKMLWGHINWEKMFRDVITELSEADREEEPEETAKSDKEEKPGKISETDKKEKKVTFEDTLVDYVPYAVNKKEGLHPGYARKYINPEEVEKRRQDAIYWIHVRHGSGLFKKTFYKRFSGKTLREFDKEFQEFVSDYLKERKDNDFSFGSQAYEFHKTFSRIIIHWQELPEVQFGDVPDEKSDLEKLLDEYHKYGLEHMKKLEEYQQQFDELNTDIK